MAEFIERAVAVAALNKALFAYEDETEAQFKNDPELDISEWFFHRIFVQNMNGIDRQTILDIPAADVRPVVRGRWAEMFDSDEYPARNHWLCCSICGHVAPFGRMSDTESRTNYCPNCGADMREES